MFVTLTVKAVFLHRVVSIVTAREERDDVTMKSAILDIKCHRFILFIFGEMFSRWRTKSRFCEVAVTFDPQILINASADQRLLA